MGISADIAAFRAKLNMAIDRAMESNVGAAAVRKIAEAVQTEVYDAYVPKVYVRRKENGGLIDTSPDNIVVSYDSTTKTLRVADMNRDNETGRLVAPVVESGKGYTYKTIPPRPFHKAAEEKMITDGDFEEALAFGLTAQGFKVTKF